MSRLVLTAFAFLLLVSTAQCFAAATLKPAATCTCLGPSLLSDPANGAVMQVPVAGLAKRISSVFSWHRRHPTLGIIMPHRGTDIAAPMGAPVFAAGNGVIQRAAKSLIYGNYLLVRYGPGCASRYAHLSRFAASIHKGTHVRTGELIGYVGSTGRSTASHLHYEFYWHGDRIDPLCTCPVAPEAHKVSGSTPAIRKARRARNGQFKSHKGTL